MPPATSRMFRLFPCVPINAVRGYLVRYPADLDIADRSVERVEIGFAWDPIGAVQRLELWVGEVDLP
jgi:hypothetical protein